MVCSVYGNSTTRALSGLTQDYTVSPEASMQFSAAALKLPVRASDGNGYGRHHWQLVRGNGFV